ncbi:MAG TPA: hypothetical protein VGV69_00495 [Solirubrobacterales bacterium]|nr:hypothetical protein [Solirubrobacterales bacterium]
MGRWFKNYGFAILVLVGLTFAAHLAATVATPDPVPDYALQAEQVYRLEIGAAFFIAFYLAAMAFVLALSGRGFAEFGTHGLKTEEVVRQASDEHQDLLSEQVAFERRTQKKMQEARFKLDDALAKLRSHEQRLERLEAER